MKEIEYRDPAMCVVSFSRQQSNGRRLFGSSIEHNQYVALKISQAYCKRHLHQDWIGEDTGAPYIEVHFSPAQFAELLTTMNYGSGVPGTVYFKDGEHFNSPELSTKAAEFKEEIQEHASEIIEGLKNAINKMKSATGPINRTDTKELISNLEKVKQNLTANLSFLMDQFVRQMDKTVTEVKAEVEAFVDLTVKRTGLEALKTGIKMIEEDK